MCNWVVRLELLNIILFICDSDPLAAKVAQKTSMGKISIEFNKLLCLQIFHIYSQTIEKKIQNMN